jgi:hypothetical protein
MPEIQVNVYIEGSYIGFFQFRFVKNTRFMDIDPDLRKYHFLKFSVNDVDDFMIGKMNYSISYSMRFNSWEKMFEITRDMLIQKYILDVGGNMTSQGYGDGILDIFIRKKYINSKINDLF